MATENLKADKKPVKDLKDKKGNIIRESSIIELMHQRNITREEAIEIYRDPK